MNKEKQTKIDPSDPNLTDEQRVNILGFEREDIVDSWTLVDENDELHKAKYKRDSHRGEIYAVVTTLGREEKIEIDDGEFLTFMVPVDYQITCYHKQIEDLNENFWP